MSDKVSLLQWVQENTDLDSLEELSLATGVNVPSIKKINNGDSLPSEMHIEAIRRVLPAMPTSVLMQHAVIAPEYIKTRRGTIPQDTEMQVGRVKDLIVGDYVPYVPVTSTGGSHWVKVEASERQGPQCTVNFGGVQRTYNSEVSIRFARAVI